MISAVLLAIFLGTSSCKGSNYDYKESLVLQQLHDGRVYSNFLFEQKFESDVNSTDWSHFPRDLGEIASEYDLNELSFSLTQGSWQEQRWKIVDSSMSDGSRTAGAELLAWFHDEL